MTTTNQNSTVLTTKQKAIGIIGGSGPEAGIDIFAKILAQHRKKLGKSYRSDRDAPNIVLMSIADLGGPRTPIDLQPGNSEGTYDASLKALIETVQKMLPLVDAFCLACNTLHTMETNILDTIVDADRDPSTFVSMVGETIRECQTRLKQRGIPNTKIAILGGPATMDFSEKSRSSGKRFLEALGKDSFYLLPPQEVKILQAIIWQIKDDGKSPTSGEALEAYKCLLKDLATKHGVSICLLNCTELPLIDITSGRPENCLPDTTTLEFIDATDVVASAVLDAAYNYPGNSTTETIPMA